jgi:hypothetical protein
VLGLNREYRIDDICGFLGLRRFVVSLTNYENRLDCYYSEYHPNEAILISSGPKLGLFWQKEIMSHWEVAMKSVIATIMAALLFLISCASTQTAEEREAIRKSNARYEYMQGR